MSKQYYIPEFNAQNMAIAVSAAISEIASELRSDVLQAMREALVADDNQRGRRALDILIENAQIAATDRVPLCQDTGSVWILLEIGTKSDGESAITIPGDIFSQVDSAVRWIWKDRALRNSMLKDALLDRTNTGDNTPAFYEIGFNPSLTGVRLSVMLKGGGSDNASRLTMLNPGDGWPAIFDFVVDTVKAKGVNACPPLVIGVGIGSTFDKVAGLAKRALLRSIDAPNPDSTLYRYETQLLQKINGLGIGAGAMGGQTTALGVSIVTAPCHIAALPVAVNVGCSAMRSKTLQLTGEWLS